MNFAKVSGEGKGGRVKAEHAGKRRGSPDGKALGILEGLLDSIQMINHI